MTPDLKQRLTDALFQEAGIQIDRLEPVRGGDISLAFRASNQNGNAYFVKTQDSPVAHRMFRAEATGLRAMHQVIPERVPLVVCEGPPDGPAFLVLEYLTPERPGSGDWQELGLALATLHTDSSGTFGFASDNFIGSLEQRNDPTPDWPDFYRRFRILPQAELAFNSRLLTSPVFKSLEQLCARFEDLLGHNPDRSLLHGDIWSGNAHFTPDPYLIDPAVYYGDREVDLAMSRLFGGFDQAFYDAYFEAYPPEPGIENRLPLYQLYYLLVHVNLFGRGYVQSVQRVIEKYGQ